MPEQSTETFPMFAALRQHRETVHETNMENVPCPIKNCPQHSKERKYFNKVTLKRHLNAVHTDLL